MVLYCIVLYCRALHFNGLHCIVFVGVVWNFFIVLYCIVLYCIVLYGIVLYCIVLYCIVLYCIVSYRIVLYCIVLYCIVLYCIPFGSTFRNQVNLVGDQLSAISWGSCLESLYCILLYCFLLHCILSSWDQLSATRLIWLRISFLQFHGVSGTWPPRRCNGVVAAALRRCGCRAGHAVVNRVIAAAARHKAIPPRFFARDREQ